MKGCAKTNLKRIAQKINEWDFPDEPRSPFRMTDMIRASINGFTDVS